MKHMYQRAMALGTALVLTLGLSTGALAAGEENAVSPAPAEQTIEVQLNGETLAFTDAAPQVKDQRTFLPFRAVFEAMGAEVSNEGTAITAVRDGKTLTMTIDSTEATLTEGETTTAITMDVAPYVDSAVWRTYVPVRFAAQAFGCAVGWDQENQTAIIVDSQKLLAAATEGKEYTLLAKYMEYNQQFQAGAWEVTAAFDADMTVMAMGPMVIDGTMKGIVADALKGQMEMNLKMDMTKLIEDLAALTGEEAEFTAEEQAMLDALKNSGIGMDIRVDMEQGLVYMMLTGEALAELGLPADVWYSMDMGAIYEDLGMDYSELMDMSKNLEAEVLLQYLLQSADLSDRDTAYAAVAALVEQAATLASDEGFKKDGDNYTATYTLDEEGVGMTMAITLITKNDKVVGYTMDVKMSMVTDAETGATSEVMSIQAGMDSKNHMTAEMKMDLAGLMTMNMSIAGDYTATDKAPVVTPPADATVVPFESLGRQPEPAEPAPTAAPDTTPAA